MNSQEPLTRLIFELSKLPGVGEKSATRMAYSILKKDPSYAQSLSQAIILARTEIQHCNECFNFTNQSLCSLCQDSRREEGILCIVAKPSDVTALEQAGAFRGKYHVLHGLLSPLDGVGPEDLKIEELIHRIQKNPSIKEILVATNPSLEGDATALFIAKLVKNLPIRVTRLAAGLPVGGMLEYSDRQTLGKAIENRMEMT